MDLKSLLAQMQGKDPEQRDEDQQAQPADSSTDSEKKLRKYSSFPTDEELQQVKEQRRGWINSLREKGLPDSIASGATAISDAITPDTQDQYMDGLAIPAIGSTENVGANAVKRGLGALSPAARSEAIVRPGALQEIGKDAMGFESKVAQEAKQARSAAQNLSDVREGVKRPGSDVVEGSGFKYERPSTDQIKQLQDEMAALNSQGKYKEAKDTLNKIRQMRENTDITKLGK